jgi:hypothetical protein
MTPTTAPASIALNRSLAKNHHHLAEEGNRIEGTERMGPFLMSVMSDGDHWLYVTSRGGMTAGRANADHALFPYYTEDKLDDMAGCAGGRLLVRLHRAGKKGAEVWEPYARRPAPDPDVSRSVAKNLLGNRLVLEEAHAGLGLRQRTRWRPSETFGFVRQQELLNEGTDTVEVELLDGLLNLLPPGLEQRFQNEFSNLGNAYKQAEWDSGKGLAVFHLSSQPTDLALPMEALRGTVAWQTGLEAEAILLTEDQVPAFYRGEALHTETRARGKRSAFLIKARYVLEPGAMISWYTCADTGMSAVSMDRLAGRIRETDIAEAIEADCRQTELNLANMLSKADGLQCTGNARATARHTSNTLFNLMRGGALPTGYTFPKEDLLKTVGRYSKAAQKELQGLMADQGALEARELYQKDHWLGKASKDLQRIVREYLPLSFSRRHGDPSRPWNRFDIVLKDEEGNPRYAYQGNWRDIFQNWETLFHSFPAYLMSSINRFLNATTADGYNPYRLTKDGYDWEVLEPNDPWANIGYWGDHQIIYLLRLLEAQERFYPGRLAGGLRESRYVYAEIPYRIRPYRRMLEHPRETIDYDEAWEKRIEKRVQARGEDGKLMPHPEGGLVYVTLVEKLLNPLAAKLANFIPGGGIWMNTQRPEWNDANNALVGYGISVVTLGYIHRYLSFLERLLGGEAAAATYTLSKELADLIEGQRGVFSEAPNVEDVGARRLIMDALGEAVSAFREGLYERGFSGANADIPASTLIDYVSKARKHVKASLLANARPDGLWHSYNLMKVIDSGVEITHLHEMLEGQVSILSSGAIESTTLLKLLGALRESALYRQDQDSYMLYPNKDLRPYTDKGHLDTETVEKDQDVLAFIASTGTRFLQKRPSGGYVFHPDFRNSQVLAERLRETGPIAVPPTTADKIIDLYERTFNHRAFTGRSGTFFAYEGLGSIYWHMVSKLALSVEELLLDPALAGDVQAKARIKAAFRAIQKGIGVDKSPEAYGAFPTDAYSHTPAHAGAQQPGMTGQVKEDILIRMAELGLRIADGCLHFHPGLLRKDEFRTTEGQLLTASKGHLEAQPIARGALGFTFCEVPVVYILSEGELSITIHRKDGETETLSGSTVPPGISLQLFDRTGAIERIEVRIPASMLD